VGDHSRSRSRSVTDVGVGAVAALGLLLALLYAPLVQLIVSSVNSNSVTARWNGFTTRWYRSVLANDDVFEAAVRSLRLAASVALTAGLVGGAAAIAVRRRPRLRSVVAVLAAARVATPEIVLAVALGILLPLVDVQFGYWTMWFGHSVLLSAYVVLVVNARLAGMPADLEAAAADLGAPPAAVVRDVVLPHIKPALAAAVMLVGAFSFDDVLLSSRLSGPQDTTLPLVILSMATRRTSPEIDAIGAIVVILGAIAFRLAVTIGRVARGPDRGEGLPL
jgi:ABC-type spermidine/putrescine transport system permease subunit II